MVFLYKFNLYILNELSFVPLSIQFPKLNTNVIGGDSKLFSYFIKNFKFTEITTYVDRSYSNGDIYIQLGFEFIGKTVPNYYYIIDNIRYYRFGFTKDILIKEGFDPNKTEHEIMIDRDIYRIYDSGNLKFSYKNFVYQKIILIFVKN